MSRTSFAVEGSLNEYLGTMSRRRESALLAELREETSTLEYARMQISVEQGRLMTTLVRSLQAKRAVEVGTFTGYSAMCIAEALPADGQLVCCDLSEEWTAMGRRYWERAGFADRIDLRIGPAADTLAALIASGGSGEYDFAFIDADKTGYDTYYESCLALLRPGGLIAIDNMFWSGKVVDPQPGDFDSIALRALTEKIFADSRVDASLVPIGDGVLLAAKRS